MNLSKPLLLLALTMNNLADAQEAARTSFKLRDEFDKKSTLEWQLIRHEPTHVSVDKNPGSLTITTQRGSIHGDSNTDLLSMGTLAKNLHFIANPADQGDFVMTTCIVAFKPTTHWHQAGLMLYEDDDNYLKCDLEWNANAPSKMVPVMLRENGAESAHFSVDPQQASDKHWLRVTKRGKLYEFAYSLDGETFTRVGEHPWGDGTPKWVGIFAKNGGNPLAAQIDCQFEFFEIRSLTKAEQEDPSYQDQHRLAGKWKVMSMEMGGKEVKLAEGDSFMVFDHGDVAIEEPNATIAAEYTLDASQTPRQMRLTKFFGQQAGIKAAYAIEKDKLTICLDPKNSQFAPDNMESKEGDDTALFKLQRIKN
ncbi:MAG: DUF1349 domain-containing protein [Pirellulaceae bacterium]